MIFKAFAFFLMAQMPDSSAEAVDAQVTVTIADGNLSKAREVAQQEAFRQAVKKVFEASEKPEDVEAKQKRATQFVRSFRVLEERNNGKELMVTYRVEVFRSQERQETSAPILSGAGSDFALEITWDPSIVRMNSQDILGFLKDRLSLQPQSFRINRGTLTIVLPPNIDHQNVQSQVSAYLSDRGQVRLVERQMPTVSEMPPDATVQPPFPGAPPNLPSRPIMTPTSEETPPPASIPAPSEEPSLPMGPGNESN